MHLALSVYRSEGFEAPDDGAIRLEYLDHGTPSFTMSAEYLSNSVVIYIRRGYLHLTVGVAAKPKG